MAPPYCMQPDFDSFPPLDEAQESIEVSTLCVHGHDGLAGFSDSTPPLTPSAQLLASPFEAVTPITPLSASSSWSTAHDISADRSPDGDVTELPVIWPFTPMPEISKPTPIHFSEIGIKGKQPISLPDPYVEPYRGLSAELRLMIWRNLLVSQKSINVNGKDWRSLTELQAIFSLCKEVYREATDIFFHDNTFRIDNRHAIRKFMRCIPDRAKHRIRKIEMVPGDTTSSQAGRSYTMAKLRERGVIDSFVRHIRPLTNLSRCTITWPSKDNWFWDKNFSYKGYLGIFALFIELRQLPDACTVVVPKASEEVQRTFQTIRNWPKGIPATSDDLDRLFRALQPTSHPSGSCSIKLEVAD